MALLSASSVKMSMHYRMAYVSTVVHHTIATIMDPASKSKTVSSSTILQKSA